MATDTGQVHLIRAGHESTQKLITSLLGPGAGNILDAHWVPLDPAAGPSGFRLELAFTRIGGVGAGNSKKRVKEAEKALLVKARALHATFQRAQAHWRRLGGALIGTGLFEEKGGSCAAGGGVWSSAWKWSEQDQNQGGTGKGGRLVFALSATPLPARPGGASGTSPFRDSTDPFSLPPAPLDSDRGLTGVNVSPLRPIPTTATAAEGLALVAPALLMSGESPGDCPAVAFEATYMTRRVETSSSSSSSSLTSSAASSGDMDPHAVLDSLKQLPFYQGQAEHARAEPPRPGAFVEFCDLVFSAGPRRGERVVSSAVEAALRARGVCRLFAHQAAAVEAALCAERRHVALSTGTSSGKSVCFNVPVLETVLEAPESVALYLFPTKALAQDQFGALDALFGGRASPLGRRARAAVVDGDATHAERGWARKEANLILTNPDMLHITLLPNHREWRRVLANLRFVVVDEAHCYRGVFGAHVAAVLRRLVRLCAFYGNPWPLQFVYCSATIQNPLEHLEQLVPLSALGGRARLTLITEDTAPRGEKLLVLWNPPLLDPGFGWGGGGGGSGGGGTTAHGQHAKRAAPPGQHREDACSSGREEGGSAWRKKRPRSPPFLERPADSPTSSGEVPMSHTSALVERCRTSAIVETARVFTALIKRGARTLCFCHTRKLTEMVLRYSLQDLRATAPELASKVKGYRGGYTKEDRRALEADLFSWRLLGVTATNALELGIDVGSLDATLHLGFPGSVSSLRQQSGRAGRAGRRSLAIMILFDSPLDQLFAREPDALLARPPEAAVIPLENQHVLRAQLLCAANECPLKIASRGVTSSGPAPSARGTGLPSTSGPHDLPRHEANLDARLRDAQKAAAEAAAKMEKGVHLKSFFDDAALFGDFSAEAVVEATRSLLQDGSLLAVTSASPEMMPAARAPGVAEAGEAGKKAAAGRVLVTVTHCECHRMIEAPAKLGAANIRLIDPVTIEVVDTTLDASQGGRTIDSIGYSRSFYELFEGAIYLHQAKQYLVTKLDLGAARAHVQPVRVPYYTSSRNHTDVEVTKRLESGTGGARLLATGAVQVVSRVWGWRKHWPGKTGGKKVADMGNFTLPPLEYGTRAVWIDVPPNVMREIMGGAGLGGGDAKDLAQGDKPPAQQKRGAGGGPVGESDEESEDECPEAEGPPGEALGGSAARGGAALGLRPKKKKAREKWVRNRFLEGVHGLNHLLCAIAPLFIRCEPEDIGTEHVYPYQQRPKPPRVIIFDKRPGGIGVAESLFRCGGSVLAMALEILETCPCEAGCLACVLDGRCTNANLDKAAALELTRRLLALISGTGEPSGGLRTSACGRAGRAGGVGSPHEEAAAAGEAAPLQQQQQQQQSAALRTTGPPTTAAPEVGPAGVAEKRDFPVLESTAAWLESSPRRRQRLRLARSMDGARERGTHVRPTWTNSLLPDSQSMHDG